MNDYLDPALIIKQPRYRCAQGHEGTLWIQVGGDKFCMICFAWWSREQGWLLTEISES